MAYYGNRRVNPTQRGAVSGPAQQAQRFNDRLPSGGRVTQAGAWTGRLASDPGTRKRWGIYALRQDGRPTTLLGQTSQVTVDAIYTTAGSGTNNGQNYSAPIELASIPTVRRSNSGNLMVYQGEQFAIADFDVFSTGGKITPVGYMGSAAKPELVYRTNNNGAQNLTNPFGNPTTADAKTLMAVWFEYTPNRAPTIAFASATSPTSGSPDSPSPIGSSGPSFDVVFDDPDRALFNDYPTRITARVYQWMAATSTWQLDTTVNYEVGVDYEMPEDDGLPATLSIKIPDGTLEAGNTYRIHVQARDEFEVWSPAFNRNSADSWVSQTDVTMVEGGWVEPTAPVGRITDLSPDLFTGVYRNEAGLSSTGVRVRILRQAGGGWVVDQTSGLITEAIAPDGTISVTWAETGFTNLQPSTQYRLEFQVVDSGANTGPWYGDTLFNTNFRPLTPTSLTPSNSTSVTSVPNITFDLTDPDDTAAGNLVAEVTITGPSGYTDSGFATKATGNNNRWSYTPVDMITPGTYTVQVRGYDGDLYGNYATGQFILDVGPVVTVLTPTSGQEFANHMPTVQWSIAGSQTAYQINLYRAGALFYTSPIVNSVPARSFQIPSGLLRAVDPDLAVQIRSRSDTSQWGSSATVPFSVLYEQPPAPQELSYTPVAFLGDDEPSVIQLNWTPVDTPPENLVRMEVWRIAASDPEFADLLAEFEGFDPGTFVDVTPISDETYQYIVRQMVIQGTDMRTGEDGTISASIRINNTILQEVGAEDQYRIVMRLFTTRDYSLTQQQAWSIPAGGSDYVETVGTGVGMDIIMNWQIVDSVVYGSENGLSATDFRDMFIELFNRQQIMFFRDPTGVSGYYRFNGNPRIGQRHGAVKYEISVPLRRVSYEDLTD